jgi:chorismate mutase
MSDDKLIILRDKLDKIDFELQNLLNQRAQISLEVKEIKGSNGTKLKPGREAQILRTLIERQEGFFPKPELIRIWREILSTSVKLQCNFDIAVYKPENQNDEEWGYMSATREHFGSNTPIITYPTQRRVIEAVLEDECAIGILPIPARNDESSWWRHLAVQGNTIKNGFASRPAKIIAQIPFVTHKIEHGSSRSEALECVAIAKSDTDPSGIDKTYIVLDLAENIPSTRIETRLAENQMIGSMLSSWHDTEAPERWLLLICIDGFILPNDSKLDRLTEGFSEVLNQVTILGSYATPFDPELSITE